MKLWDKNISTQEKILSFTTGMDPVFDLELSPYDVMGSMAHAIMLAEVGLIKRDEAALLVKQLAAIYKDAEQGLVKLDPGMEDIHSQVEMMLTASLGDIGKRIHTGRSRNDQVMVDIKLYLREEIQEIVIATNTLALNLLSQAALHKDILMPGYTHMQVAMPSSFGLWFGAYAEALADDLTFMQGVYEVVNQNPLGSAAGFGSSFRIDRELTTRLLGFGSAHINSVNAQLNRGKTEWYVGSGISAIASSVARMAMDMVLFMGQNFKFLSLPDEMTTGSSIMPHKKNPDVVELIRARCNRLVHTPSEISAVTTNLISGYHRDFQVLKEVIHPAIADLKNCLHMMHHVMEHVKVNTNILENETYQYIFSVEEVNKKVKTGMPFRDAYREVAAEIDSGHYRPGRDHTYTHLGSIGNPGTEQVRAKLKMAFEGFGFVSGDDVVELLKNYFGKS
jgi:argininosuccinate lyase